MTNTKALQKLEKRVFDFFNELPQDTKVVKRTSKQVVFMKPDGLRKTIYLDNDGTTWSLSGKWQ